MGQNRLAIGLMVVLCSIWGLQQVAIKLVRPVHLMAPPATRQELVRRFEHERAILARMPGSSALPPSETPTATNGRSGSAWAKRRRIQSISSKSPEW